VTDRALPADVIDALSARFNTVTARRTMFPYAFTMPAGVLREGGKNMGCSGWNPWRWRATTVSRRVS